ncbi:hypothetical protein ACFRAU_09655 [Arthrobacter sp. NPDC056691]|uniref:hypothetical protein n=1 Tax=Arthrobacter sp. NPDC056691 TaxID=3345913 RepID=UPI003671ACDC
MSGQQHSPVPETTPLPPAPQPDGHSAGWGFGGGTPTPAPANAGPAPSAYAADDNPDDPHSAGARPAEPATEPVTSLGTFSSGGAAFHAAPHAVVSNSPAPGGDPNTQTPSSQAADAQGPNSPAPYPGWGAGGAQPPADGTAGAGWGGPPSAGKSGGPAASGKPWTMKRGLVVAGAATVLAAGAGATVYGLGSNAAAAGGTAAGPQGGLAQGGTQGGLSQGGAQGGLPQDGGSMGGPGGMQAPGGDFAPNGLGGMGSGVSAAVHSEYVVEENGEYVSKVAQLGTVSTVSSGAVTVKSADGFTRTYTLSDDTVVSNMLQRRQQSATGGLTVADIVSGATVRIVAGKDGSAFPAESVQVSGTATQSGGTSGSSQSS